MYRRLQSVSVAIAGETPGPIPNPEVKPPAPMVLPGKLGGE